MATVPRHGIRRWRLPVGFLLLGVAVVITDTQALAADGPDFDYIRRRTVAISVQYNLGGDWQPYSKGLGTGFLVHETGFVLTAKHVAPEEVSDPNLQHRVKLFGRIGDRSSREMPLKVISVHPTRDAMLLHIERGGDPERLDYFTLSDKDTLPVIQVSAAGFPALEDGKLKIVTEFMRGPVARGVHVGVVNARLDGGFSGGPVLSGREVVGLVVNSSTDANRDTFGFVPIRSLKDWINEDVPLAGRNPKPAGERPEFVNGLLKFDRELLQYDVTIKNPGPSPVILTHVGVETSDTQGDFGCYSGESSGLIPIADYTVPFHVSQPSTQKPAKPPLLIPAGGSARFGVTLQPSDLGACTRAWSTNITMVLYFDDDTKLSAPKQKLGPRDLVAVRGYSPSEEKVLWALHHRNPATRIAAVQAVPQVGFTRESQILLLGARLKDPNLGVRLQVLVAIRDSKLTELDGDIAGLLDRRTAEFAEANDVSEEVSEVIRTLVALGASDRPDAIIRACLNLHFRLDSAVRALAALEDFQDPAVVEPLMRAISERHDWLMGDAAARHVKTRDAALRGPDSRPARYLVLIEALVRYGSAQSIKFLHGIFERGDAYNLHKAEILRFVELAVPRDRIPQAPFVRSFEPVAKGLLHHWDATLRCRAFRLYSRLSSGEDRLNAVKEGLADPSVCVRIAAVQAVADSALPSLKPVLEKMRDALARQNPLDEGSVELKREIDDAIESLGTRRL